MKDAIRRLLLAIGGAINPAGISTRREPRNERRSDIHVIASDWEAVGRDLARATHRFGKGAGQ